ncbi:TPM domain-containing protein [Candidatus Sulfidibacterium hydrothermale]|uniref:TPM domain-containing protein n=1 Tax=Candidatus Sulfidibacterium hydrothermale TaxID=2875962 RepID=UPI001F0ACBE9|nr:TPM domain-containing protein [Candidatus Sulfidibacterium hydrothermale]UBM61344.1 TPM domain-containing protein [Candidatus Sulfidibacterium hydrothermale]UBM61387.1 TPM domain-containing protein [Candidatus Sulfidibacterium hydrothermale]
MNKIIGIILTFLSLTAHSQLVVDNGHFFTKNEIARLENKMQNIENKYSIETMIYTTIDLNGKTPIEYGKEIGNSYEVGKKGINNGILILLSKNDRRIQILNGFGIEWIISDTKTQKIVDQMIPFFKQQNFFGGVNNALTMIEKYVSKTDWKISEIGLNNISENDLGKIIKFKYSNKSGQTKYKYAIDTDTQFSNNFQIKLESNKTEFNLFYSKNMNDLISIILTRKNIIVYARLTDWQNKRLELLGIE